MIRIIFGAIFLTLIAVPITIAITKKTFKILATQILSLEKDTPVSILFTDIDFFKRYNDFHGHVAGDVCLKKVAAILNRTFENDDNKWAYRYGGEEFAVICTDCDKESAIKVAELIAKNLKEENIPHGDSLIEKRVTLSIGVATGTLESMTMDDILMDSDRAVYISKETGRNRYTHFDNIK